MGLRGIEDYTAYKQLQKSLNFKEIAQELINGQGLWQRTNTIFNAYLDKGDLIEISTVWFYLVNLVLKPSKHVSAVRQDHTLLLYALVKGFELDVGKIIKESILDYAKNNFLGNIPHPSLITLICIKGGVKVNKEK